jgi:NADH-quinone oxidoreductase subunit D
MPVISIGPVHPLLDEPVALRLEVEGKTIKGAEIEIGHIHRGIEKLSERMTFEQVTFLVERICGICSNVHPLCFVQAVEDIGGIEIPERAKYIRTIIAELERIHSHLLWLGIAGHILGADEVFLKSWKYREPVLDIFELVCGNRQNYAMMAVGGVRKDISPSYIPKIIETLKLLREKVPELAEEAESSLKKRLRGIGVLTRENAIAYCTTGPTARAAGVASDTRKVHPYAAYPELEFDIVKGEEGDVLAQTEVRIGEVLQSVRILEQALKNLPPGEIRAEFKNIPPGEGIGLAEAPRGEDIHYVRTNGTNMPERHKIRAPTYVNLPALETMLLGNKLEDALIIVASIDPCFSCTDRVTVVNEKGEEKIMSEEELLRMSRNAAL